MIIIQRKRREVKCHGVAFTNDVVLRANDVVLCTNDVAPEGANDVARCANDVASQIVWGYLVSILFCFGLNLCSSTAPHPSTLLTPSPTGEGEKGRLREILLVLWCSPHPSASQPPSPLGKAVIKPPSAQSQAVVLYRLSQA